MIFALQGRNAKVHTSTPFLRVDPEFLRTCLMCPCRTFYDTIFYLFIFTENVGSLKTQISEKKHKTPNIWRKKQINKQTIYIHSLKARQGYIKHVCKISESKTAWTFVGVWRILGLMLEPAGSLCTFHMKGHFGWWGKSCSITAVLLPGSTGRLRSRRADEVPTTPSRDKNENMYFVRVKHSFRTPWEKGGLLLRPPDLTYDERWQGWELRVQEYQGYVKTYCPRYLVYQ